jgi:hypothetical protein
MRSIFIVVALVTLAGCSSNKMYYSPFDLNRDGTLDAVCPGMEYDATEHSHYGWRSDASKECRERNETTS